MVDLTVPLGRPVPTATQVVDVIRGSLRLAAVIGPALLEAMRLDRPAHDEDLNLDDGSDAHAERAVFNALVEAGMANVKDGSPTWPRSRTDGGWSMTRTEPNGSFAIAYARHGPASFPPASSTIEGRTDGLQHRQ